MGWMFEDVSTLAISLLFQAIMKICNDFAVTSHIETT